MDLQTALLVAALAITVLVIAGYAWLLRERIRGLEEQRQSLRRDTVDQATEPEPQRQA